MVLLNVEAFTSEYPYTPSRPKSAWHLFFDRPAGTNEDQAHSFSEDDTIYVDALSRQALKFSDVRTLSKRLAYGFLNRVDGLKSGDTVLIFASNSIYYPACYLGAQAAGLGKCDGSTLDDTRA